MKTPKISQVEAITKSWKAPTHTAEEIRRTLPEKLTAQKTVKIGRNPIWKGSYSNHLLLETICHFQGG